jgi:hypothetical protein
MHRSLRALPHDHFDWVIVDSPPVMAVADSSIHFACGVGRTVRGRRRHDQPACRRQGHRSARGDTGQILRRRASNRADLDRNPYYYRQYYRREYATYYQGRAGA